MRVEIRENHVYIIGVDTVIIVSAPPGVTLGVSVQHNTHPLRQQEIGAMALSTRTRNALVAAGYKTFGEVMDLPERELLRVKNLGRKCRKEIAAMVAALPEA